MTEFALLNAYSYVAGHDFTGDTNQVELSGEATVLDATTFRSNGWNERITGLKNLAFNMQGFWQSATEDAVDPEAFGDLTVSRAHTFGPVESEGQPAYMFMGLKSRYQWLGDLNTVTPFTLNTVGSDGVGVVRGLLAKAKGAMTATGALGSVVNLGAVPSGQYLYATFHVFGAGTTATVQVQSDDAAGMASPTLRGTIGPVTARGGTWMVRVPGPITDTHYRFNVSAITGAFVAAGAIGIGR